MAKPINADITVHFEIAAAVAGMRDLAATYRRLAYDLEDAASVLSEKQARRTGKCDGNHGFPVCVDDQCWRRD